MKNINKNKPPFENKSEESKEKDRANLTENPDDDMVDPLEVVIQEEKDEIAEEFTQDDMFDDDKLDLDPTLDQDEW